jgi:hypothetical protein
VGPEVDFIIDRPGRPVAIECKWSASSFDPGGIQACRRRYPGRLNLVVAEDVRKPFDKRFGPVRIRFVGLEHLPAALKAGSSSARR